MPARAELLESEAACGAEGLTRSALPGLASGISPSLEKVLAAPRAGAQHHSRCLIAPEKHRREDRPLGWETLRADETLTATWVFGFYWGMLQANCSGGPSLEVTAQHQAACTDSYRPHTRHGLIRAHPTDHSRSRSGGPVSSLPCTGELRCGCFQGSFQSSRSRPVPGLLLQAKVSPKTRPIHLTLNPAARLKISQ